MDVKKIVERLQQSMHMTRWTPQSFAILALACVLVIGAIIVRSQPQSAEQDVLFVGQTISAVELQRIEAALGKANLANYSAANGLIRVPREERGRYLAAIQDANALPQSFQRPTQDALKASSLLESPRHTSQRMEHAREEELRFAISKVNGVSEAFLFFDEKMDRSLRSENRMTAVAAIRTRDDRPLDLAAIRMIQEMILGFKAGLKVEDVTINVLNTGQSFRGLIGRPGSPEARMLVCQSLEREWQQNLRQLLHFVPDANIVVRVVPKLDPAEAQLVKVSVGIPASFVRRIGRLSPTADLPEELVVQACEQVRSTIIPLLPNSQQAEETMSELVVVNVFEPLNSDKPMLSQWGKLAGSPLLIAGFIVALLACFVLLTMPNGRSQSSTLDPPLRVYPPETGESGAATNADESSASSVKLRAFVAEDPAAVARSLSDFIDRAS